MTHDRQAESVNHGRRGLTLLFLQFWTHGWVVAAVCQHYSWATTSRRTRTPTWLDRVSCQSPLWKFGWRRWESRTRRDLAGQELTRRHRFRKQQRHRQWEQRAVSAMCSAPGGGSDNGGRTKEDEKPSLHNHLLGCGSLRHAYYALRHGQSMANVDKIISSDPAISTETHGLSPVGREQARKAGLEIANIFQKENYAGVAIFSSDFLRAKETAETVAKELQSQRIPLYSEPSDIAGETSSGIQLEVALRERFFGDWNGKSDSHYPAVWEVDQVDPNHTQSAVESANSVLERTTRLVLQLDSQLDLPGEEWMVLLVAHGDVLQILQTGFLQLPNASHHRTASPHLETATVRKLELIEASQRENND